MAGGFSRRWGEAPHPVCPGDPTPPQAPHTRGEPRHSPLASGTLGGGVPATSGLALGRGGSASGAPNHAGAPSRVIRRSRGSRLRSTAARESAAMTIVGVLTSRPSVSRRAGPFWRASALPFPPGCRRAICPVISAMVCAQELREERPHGIDVTLSDQRRARAVPLVNRFLEAHQDADETCLAQGMWRASQGDRRREPGGKPFHDRDDRRASAW
jgi:hypothetical protein